MLNCELNAALYMIGIIILALIAIISIPFLFVWALNMLGLSIAYTFKTWLAVLIIKAFLSKDSIIKFTKIRG